MAKTGFKIDKELKSQIEAKKGLLRKVSKDRLLLEVVKLFSQGHSGRSYHALSEFNCLAVLFPGFERLKVNLSLYQSFFEAVFKHIDLQYRQKKRLSSSFLFAALLWPIVEVQKKKQSRVNLFQHKKTIGRVLKFESRYIAIPKKLQDAIKELWVLQYVFETKTTPFAQERIRQARFQHAHTLLMLRAKFDETLTEKALMWQDNLPESKE